MGRKKTYEERMEEIRLRKEWLNRQPPLKSPCLTGRRRHCFGRGVGKIHKHCVYCRKSREQIRAEQRGKMPQMKFKCKNCGVESEYSKDDLHEGTSCLAWMNCKHCHRPFAIYRREYPEAVELVKQK